MFGSFTRNAASMFSQLLDKKESGESVAADEADEAAQPADEPQETVAAQAEEE
jgi:hypothetical protein